MIELIRNNIIRKKYSKGKVNMIELSKEYGISLQRISTIIKQKDKYCKVHKNNYYSSCQLCTVNKDINDFINLQDKILNTEINYCASKIRDIVRSEMFIKRLRSIIAILYDKHCLSFEKIGKLLNRNHSTIKYHYDKSKNI